MENKGLVNRIIPFSNVDGPGNRLAIFFQGCNINCVYCHNPETINNCVNCMACIEGCPAKAITDASGVVAFDEKLCTECDRCIKTCRYSSSPRTKVYTVDELYSIIEDYRLFIRGITVSGGEPTLQWEFITELFRRVKTLGLTCFVDTNGFFDRDKISGLIQEADKFMVDIKSVDEIESICGTSMKNNLDNLKYLLELNKVYEVRTVMIHDYMDIENTVLKVGKILKDYPEVIYKLIRVHSSGLTDRQKNMIKDHIPSEEYVREIADRVREIGVKRVELIL